MENIIKELCVNGWCNIFNFISVIIIAILTLYELIVYLPLLFQRSIRPESNEKIKISVVIAARNEEQNLMENLPSILGQDYPYFEVIVVDDGSTDQTIGVLEAFKLRYKNFKYSMVKHGKNFEGGKKFALTMGIKAASFDYVVFTDADCAPVSDKWLQYYAHCFDNKNADVVLGFGDYKGERSFLNSLIKLDTFLIATQYLGFANLGVPYMGVGRNMGYRKDLFFKEKGFSKHMSLRSGDDDLFINALSSKQKVAILIDSLSSTVSIAEKTFMQWLIQKLRHLSTFPRYKFHKLIISGLYSISKLLFWILFPMVFFTEFNEGIVLTFYLGKLLLSLLIFGLINFKMGKPLKFINLMAEVTLVYTYIYLMIKRIEFRRRPWISK